MKGLIFLLRRFHFVLILLCWSRVHSLYAENLTRQNEIAHEVERLRNLDGRDKYEAELEPSTQQELQDRLKDAEKW